MVVRLFVEKPQQTFYMKFCCIGFRKRLLDKVNEILVLLNSFPGHVTLNTANKNDSNRYTKLLSLMRSCYIACSLVTGDEGLIIL